MCQLSIRLVLVVRYYRPKICNLLSFHLKSSENLEAFLNSMKSWNGISCMCKVCQYYEILANYFKWSEGHYRSLQYLELGSLRFFLTAFSRLTQCHWEKCLRCCEGHRSISVDVFEKFSVSDQNKKFSDIFPHSAYAILMF